jgi:hypothetical protein
VCEKHHSLPVADRAEADWQAFLFFSADRETRLGRETVSGEATATLERKRYFCAKLLA